MPDYDKSKILDKLFKIKELINSPNEAESKAAKEMLDNLMKKYNIEESDLNIIELHWFKYDKYEWYSRKLLYQIMYSIMGKTEKWKNGSKRHHVGIYCTKEQAIEIEAKYYFYYNEFKKELEIFVSAYIMRNKLYPPDNLATVDESEPTEEDIKAYELSQSLELKKYHKQLEE